MNVSFVRFQASDNVELQGWLSNSDSDVAAIHIHGMSGNGYENYFLDNIREMYQQANISFFSINTRGHGVISSFWQNNATDTWGEGTKTGGSCFEIFIESAFDIQGAIDYLKSLGKTKFILQGHSLGGSKVVHYLVTQNNPDILASILLAPTDMVGWASADPNHQSYLQKAKDLLSQNRGRELVSPQCWLDMTPLSAQTYPTISEAGTAVDIYGPRENGALLGMVEVPTLIAYGDTDIGITKIDGTMEAWLERANAIKNRQTKIAVLKGASHSFKGFEVELSTAIEKFLKSLL